MKKHAYFISNLYCLKCGALFPIPRTTAQKRKQGHIKHLYCPCCHKRTPHEEKNHSLTLAELDNKQEI